VPARSSAFRRIRGRREATARREFPDEDPIGRRFSFGPGEDGHPHWVTIVGASLTQRRFTMTLLATFAVLASLVPALRAARVDRSTRCGWPETAARAPGGGAVSLSTAGLPPAPYRGPGSTI
jgi:hypothetical protein